MLHYSPVYMTHAGCHAIRGKLGNSITWGVVAHTTWVTHQRKACESSDEGMCLVPKHGSNNQAERKLRSSCPDMQGWAPAGLANGGAQAHQALVARGPPDGVACVSAHADHGVVG